MASQSRCMQRGPAIAACECGCLRRQLQQALHCRFVARCCCKVEGAAAGLVAS